MNWQSSNVHITAWRRCQCTYNPQKRTHIFVRSVNWATHSVLRLTDSHCTSNLMPVAFCVWCFARILKSCKLNFPLAQITTSGIVGLPLRVFWTWNKLQYLFRHQLNDVPNKCSREWQNKCTAFGYKFTIHHHTQRSWTASVRSTSVRTYDRARDYVVSGLLVA